MYTTFDTQIPSTEDASFLQGDACLVSIGERDHGLGLCRCDDAAAKLRNPKDVDRKSRRLYLQYRDCRICHKQKELIACMADMETLQMLPANRIFQVCP
jgi:hypothetical protein